MTSLIHIRDYLLGLVCMAYSTADEVNHSPELRAKALDQDDVTVADYFGIELFQALHDWVNVLTANDKILRFTERSSWSIKRLYRYRLCCDCSVWIRSSHLIRVGTVISMGLWPRSSIKSTTMVFINYADLCYLKLGILFEWRYMW